MRTLLRNAHMSSIVTYSDVILPGGEQNCLKIGAGFCREPTLRGKWKNVVDMENLDWFLKAVSMERKQQSLPVLGGNGYL